MTISEINKKVDEQVSLSETELYYYARMYLSTHSPRTTRMEVFSILWYIPSQKISQIIFIKAIDSVEALQKARKLHPGANSAIAFKGELPSTIQFHPD